MAKLALDDITNISGAETSAIATINDNNDAVVAALENTLSRDGTSPNEMNADFDMNSYRILNLPEPLASTEPVRKADLDNAILGTYDSGALLGTSVTAVVSSIAALRAITSATVDVPQLILNSYYGDYKFGGGYFKYDSSDAVTADDGGMVIVDASSRRWKRQITNELVTPYSFGAKGDGVTNDTTALSNWLDYAIANAGGVFVGAGSFLINTAISKTLSNPKDFSILGLGNASRFIVNNTTGGLKFNIGARVGLTILNLRIEPAIGSTTGSGYGLWVDGPGSSSSSKNAAFIQNVHFTPKEESSVDYWFTDPLKVTSCKRPKIQDCTYGPGVNAGVTQKANQLIDISNSYQAKVMRCWFNARATYGVKSVWTGSGNEGFDIIDSTIVKADYGIYYEDTSRSPSFYISGNHINSYIQNIHIDGLKYGFIERNLFYVNLDEIGYTYTQSGTTVTVTSNEPHLFTAADTFTIENVTGTLAAGNYTVATTPTSTSFTFTASSATTSGIFTITVASSRSFQDIRLYNADGVTIRNNIYQQSEASKRTHVLIGTTGSVSGSPITRDIIIQDDVLVATTTLAAYKVNSSGDNIHIRWNKVSSAGTYPTTMLDISSSATGVDARPVNPVLYSDTTDTSSDGTLKVLMSYLLPIGLLYSTRGVETEVWGTYLNNGSAKTLRFLFGAQIYEASLTTSVAGSWRAKWKVIRTGVDTQTYVFEFTDSNAANTVIQAGDLTQTETSTVNTRTVSTAATAAGHVTQTGMTVTYL